MADREKVIRGLECHKAGLYKVIDILGACGTDDCDNCPLNGDERCSGFIDVPVEVLMDAIALLKEQETNKNTKRRNKNETRQESEVYHSV